MKNWKRIFCAMLAGILCLSTATACKENSGGNNGNNKETIANDLRYDGGTHIFNVNATQDYLVKDGKSDYKIVVSKDAPSVILTNVNTMVNYIKQATGIVLPIVTDENVSYTEQEKIISIGYNALCKQLNLDASNLGASGLRILTKGKSIFIYGKTDDGTRCGLYEFLNQILDYEFYAEGCVSIAMNVKNIPLMNYDITDLPDFELRNRGYEIMDNYEYRNSTDAIATLCGAQWHNSFKCLPPETYKTDHPAWYATSGDQLCYTAKGNAEELQAMQELVIEKMKVDIANQPTKPAITFTLEDAGGWCTCSACEDMAKKYGAKSSVYISFLKPIAAEIERWLQETDPERDLTILMFAYVSALEPPVQLVNGEYVLTHEDMELPANMGVVYAPIEADYGLTFADDVNTTVYECMKGWKAVTENMWYWIYGFNVDDYFVPFDVYSSLKDNYIYLLQNNAKWVFNQCYHDEKAPSHFTYLAGYLQSKLQWDVNQDVNELIENFMANYFKDAAPAMTKYYNEMMANFAYLKAEKDFDGRIKPSTQSYMYPYTLLSHWSEYIDEAYKAIEKYKIDDAKLYNEIARRINIESLTIRYLQINFYSVYYSYSDLMERKLQFKQDCGTLGVTCMSERRSISLLWESWGI